MDRLLCALCLTDLPKDAMGFCPRCGGAILSKGSVISGKSTANFDPSSRDFKPWRDRPLLPKRNYKLAQEKPQPWYPTMRVLSRPVFKPKPDPSTARTSQDPADISPNDRSHSFSVDEKSGDPDSSAHTAAESVRPEQQDEERTAALREVIYPLAAYEVDISGATSKVIMLVSLVEHLFGRAGVPREYWLKVSAAEDDALPADAGSSGNDSSIVTDKIPSGFSTVYLSNSVCALLFPFEKWLDLDKIDADQFYVAQHMQQALEFLPNRIIKCRRRNTVFFWNLPNPQKEEDASQMVYIEATVTVEHRQATWTSLSYGQNADPLAVKIVTKHRRHVVQCTDCEELFSFDECVLEHKGTIKISRSCPVRHLAVMVRSSAQYQSRCSLSNGQQVTKEELRKSARASHLHITATPCGEYVVSGRVPSLDLTLDVNALQLLLTGSTLEDVLQACDGQQEMWQIYVDRLLALLRLEFTTEEGIALTVVGSFCDPVHTSQPWPDEVLSLFPVDHEDCGPDER